MHKLVNVSKVIVVTEISWSVWLLNWKDGLISIHMVQKGLVQHFWTCLFCLAVCAITGSSCKWVIAGLDPVETPQVTCTLCGPVTGLTWSCHISLYIKLTWRFRCCQSWLISSVYAKPGPFHNMCSRGVVKPHQWLYCSSSNIKVKYTQSTSMYSRSAHSLEQATLWLVWA